MLSKNYESKSTEDLIVDLGVRQPKLEKNKEYLSEVKNVSIQRNVPTQYGISDSISMEYHVYKENINGDSDIVVIKQKYFLSKGEQTRFGKMYKSLTGKTPEGRINLAELIGKKCSVLIDHNESENGDIFDNISEVKKLNDSFNLNEGMI